MLFPADIKAALIPALEASSNPNFAVIACAIRLEIFVPTYKTFDFINLGESIAAGVNNFFATFDFGSLAETLNVWVQEASSNPNFAVIACAIRLEIFVPTYKST